MRKEDSNPHRPVRVKIRQAVLPIQTIPHFYYALIAEGPASNSPGICTLRCPYNVLFELNMNAD